MRVLRGLAQLTQAEEGDVKRLQHTDPPELRLRVGTYRIRLYDHGDTIEILRVKHRSEASAK